MNKEHKLLLHPPFFHSDHLVIKVQITIWAPTPINIHIKLFIDVYIKAPFGANLYKAVRDRRLCNVEIVNKMIT